MLKILDKFLNALKTDRNTFFTYILSLLTVYFLVDRLIEFAFIIFTGVAYYYWSPIMYTVALVIFKQEVVDKVAVGGSLSRRE